MKFVLIDSEGSIELERGELEPSWTKGTRGKTSVYRYEGSAANHVSNAIHCILKSLKRTKGRGPTPDAKYTGDRPPFARWSSCMALRHT